MGLFDLWFLDWSDLERSQRLPDRDVVSVSYDDIDPDTTEIALQLARPLDWWKGIQTLNGTNAQIAFTEAEGRDGAAGPDAVPSGDLATGGHLVMWKAKTFGVHTPMYALADLEHIKGKRVTFRWIAD
jgi:hypothetical protein